MLTNKIYSFSWQAAEAAGELPVQEQNLIEEARKAALNAYSPYSGFSVGAALLLENGEIVTGSNQENAAYPSGLCAERTALFYAGSRYPGVAVVKMAVTACRNNTFLTDAVSPCGACRQVMLETQMRQQKPFRLILAGQKTIHVIEDPSHLLPFPFDKLGQSDSPK